MRTKCFDTSKKIEEPTEIYIEGAKPLQGWSCVCSPGYLIMLPHVHRERISQPQVGPCLFARMSSNEDNRTFTSRWSDLFAICAREDALNQRKTMERATPI